MKQHKPSKLSNLASGVSWGTVSVVTVTVFQLMFMGIMARLLEPADFGLVAIANISLRFFSYFSQMGIAPALIQKKSLSDGDIQTALALSLSVSGFFFLLAISTAGIVERIFEINSLAVVMQVLAINFIVFGFSSVSLGLIRRNRAFKALAIIEIISYVSGYGVIGLGAAYFGAGVWALVAAFLSQTLLTAILGYSVVRHPISLKHTKAQRSHFISYGGRYSIIGFIEFLTSNIDSLIVGKLLGTTVAGYYNRSLLLANLPVQHPTRILTQTLFPIMSSISNQHDKQSISVQLGTLLVGCYAFSVGAGIFVAAPDIVKVLLGDKWLDSIPVLQVLACSVGPIYVANVAGVTLDSMGELSVKLRIQFAVFIVLLILLFLVAPSGNAESIAMAVVATFWIRVFFMNWAVIHVLKIPALNVFKNVVCFVLVTATTGILILIAKRIVFDAYPVIVHLITEIMFGVIGFGIGLFFIRMVISHHPAVLYLSERSPVVAKFIRR